MWTAGWLHLTQAEREEKEWKTIAEERDAWCCDQHSEVLGLFLIVLDIVQLLTAFSALLLLSTQVYADTAFGMCFWCQGSCSHYKGYWAEDEIATSSHLPKSLRNKMHQKENTSLGCWWFLEENLICNLCFSSQRFVCMDFIAVKMRHLVTMASASPALGRHSTGSLTSPWSKYHLCSRILCMVLQAEVFGQQHNYSTLRSGLKIRGQK